MASAHYPHLTTAFAGPSIYMLRSSDVSTTITKLKKRVLLTAFGAVTLIFYPVTLAAQNKPAPAESVFANQDLAHIQLRAPEVNGLMISGLITRR